MKIVILGAGGRLGAALMRGYRDKYDITGFNHAQLDLASLDDLRGKLSAMSFDVLINAAALTSTSKSIPPSLPRTTSKLARSS